MGAPFATHLLFLFCLLTATFSLNFFKVESNVSCHAKEKQALLTLKQGLIDLSVLSPLSSWSDQQDCCTWDGVRCDNKTGRVIELTLNGIVGEISPSLLELKFLNHLDFSISDFNCSRIPSFLGSMDNLRHLDLSNAAFCGLIPPQLGNLSGLHYLDLGGNSYLYVDNLRWMSGLSSIQYFNLNSVNLHKEVVWLQIMSKLSSLSELYLSSCGLDSLNPSLRFVNFTSLRVLDLSQNHFHHEIPNWFLNLSTSLLNLYLSENSLIGNIPHSIFNLQRLEYLEVQLNSLSGKFPESLGQLKHLSYLNLEGNSLSGPIPLSLGNLSEMQNLNLARNKLNGTIPKTLGLLSNLVSLSISLNFFTGGLEEVHFAKLWKLKKLDMSHTLLFFNVNSNWVPPFQLEQVDMSSCKIGPKFPPWLQTQRSLQFLVMPMSRISGNAPSWFWNWSSNINTIDLSENQIKGDVPDILLNSVVLNLRSNHFKGRLPRLSTNVKVLNIANNSFSGPISTFLCNKLNRKNDLQVLDASNNLFLGELSNCWRYWQSLIHLNLGSNSLSGKIPYSMGSLVKLKSLRLQNNSISGDFPLSLKKCLDLGLIDIGDNHLSGTISLWIREMTHLIILRLRSNGFKGNIPLKICQLSSLRVLDLANNSLSEPIPNCLKNISAMAVPEPNTKDTYFDSLEYNFGYSSYIANLMLVPKGNELEYEENLKFVRIIDVSSNNLSGSIPIEISFLFELRFLNLSRNHLMGSIPEKIGGMKELESIDLSRNHISGEIPPSLSNLTFLSYLDLSYNNLSGRIPSSTQLQSFDALNYIGNPQLCGEPLPKKCAINEEAHNRTSMGKTEDNSQNSSFSMGMGVGFAVGFWTVCGGLFFNKTWRHAYFKFLNDIKDWLYVTTILKVNWILEKLRSSHLI